MTGPRGRRRWPRVFGVAGILWSMGLAGRAAAQPAEVLPGRWDVHVAAIWVGSERLGGRAATLTANEVVPTEPLVLFRTSSALRRRTGVEARLGWRLGGNWSVEGGFAFARPRLQTTVTGDFEGVPPAAASERVAEYIVDGGLRVELGFLRFAAGRGRPFVTGGAGYLRQLHADRALVTTGRVYYAGAGVSYALRRRAARSWQAVGLRGDVRLRLRDGGLAFDRRRQAVAVAAMGVWFRF